MLQLLSQLYYADILYYNIAPDKEKLFERYRKRRQKETQSKLLNIMFIRIPLLDPDLFLNRITPVIHKIFSIPGFLVWLLVLFFAGKILVDNFEQALEQAQGVLAPDNLVWLYTGLVIVKVLHEFGHAVICKRFGGEVHVMGVMLMVFSPLPYMDATSSWGFREPWKRMAVGSAGMFVELFIAGLAVFVWAATGQGVLHSVAYNIMFVASVSTVLFNANPLIRLDGYYILSDLLDIPNLSGKATHQLRHLVEKKAFGLKDSVSPAQSKKRSSTAGGLRYTEQHLPGHRIWRDYPVHCGQISHSRPDYGNNLPCLLGIHPAAPVCPLSFIQSQTRAQSVEGFGRDHGLCRHYPAAVHRDPHAQPFQVSGYY